MLRERPGGRVARVVGAPDFRRAQRRAEGRRRRRRQPQNADGSTPLQWAVYEGDVAEVRRLLAAGADVSLANKYGATRDEPRRRGGGYRVLELLLAAGADADSPNADGQTALMAVARTGTWKLRNVDRARRHGRCTGGLRRTDRSHVGVCTPAPQMIELLISHGAAVTRARSVATISVV